jgi:hypothetical protein
LLLFTVGDVDSHIEVVSYSGLDIISSLKEVTSSEGATSFIFVPKCSCCDLLSECTVLSAVRWLASAYCFKTTLEENTGIMVFDEVLV